MKAEIVQKVVEGGVFTELRILGSGKHPDVTYFEVHSTLVGAAEWAQDHILAKSAENTQESPEKKEINE